MFQLINHLEQLVGLISAASDGHLSASDVENGIMEQVEEAVKDTMLYVFEMI